MISSEENKYDILSQAFLALSIILFAFSGIIYFLKKQFDKLANIADEIEKGVYDNEESSEENNIEKP